MSTKRLGNQTVKLQNPPSIVSTASIVGPKEGKGPLRLFLTISWKMRCGAKKAGKKLKAS